MLQTVWDDLKKLEGFLVSLLNVWAVIADLLSQVGTPVKVVSTIAALLALISLIIQDAITAVPTGGLPALLTTLVSTWSVVSANLDSLGVPVKIVTTVGAGLALCTLIFQRAVTTNKVDAMLRQDAAIRAGITPR